MLPWLIVFGVLVSPLVIAVGIVAWAGAAFLVEAWHCDHPSTEVVERLGASRTSLADEAGEWLSRQ